MKKILSVFMIMAAAFIVASCGDGPAPSETVDAAYKALLQKDYEGYASHISFAYAGDEKAQEQARNMTVSMVKKVMEGGMGQEADPIETYEIGKETINGDSATVEVTTTTKKGKKETQTLSLVKEGDKWMIDGNSKNKSKSNASEGDAAEALEALSKLGDALGDSAKNKVEEGAEKAKDAVEDAGKKIEEAGKEAGKAIEEAGKDVEKALKD